MMQGPSSSGCSSRFGSCFSSTILVGSCFFSGGALHIVDNRIVSAFCLAGALAAAYVAVGDEKLPVVRVETARPAVVERAPVGEAILPGGLCNLDRIAGVAADKGQAISPHARTDMLSFEGWAVDPAEKSAFGEVFVRFEKQQAGSVEAYDLAAKRQQRGDVADALHEARYAYAGFVLAASAEGLPAGVYAVKVVQKEGPYRTVCDVGRQIEIL